MSDEKPGFLPGFSHVILRERRSTVEIITSKQNPQILHAVRLQERKHRQKDELFVFDGIKLCKEAMLAGVIPEKIYLRMSSREHVLAWMEQELPGKNFSEHPALIALDDAVFEKISLEKSPEGIICVAKYIDKCHKIVTINNKEHQVSYSVGASERILLLESVRDPGNLGTIIRSAAAFGIDRLILSEDCADLYNAKTIRASMGAIFRQRIDRTNDLPTLIRCLRSDGRRVYAAALDATAAKLGTLPLKPQDGIVIGNEGHGLTDASISACDGCLFIPMTGATESLNAAMAATVCMWELYRGQITL